MGGGSKRQGERGIRREKRGDRERGREGEGKRESEGREREGS